MVVVRAHVETRQPMLYASLIVVWARCCPFCSCTAGRRCFAPMAAVVCRHMCLSMLVALAIVTPPRSAACANVPLQQAARSSTGWPCLSIVSPRHPARVPHTVDIACYALWSPLRYSAGFETDLVIKWRAATGTSAAGPMIKSTRPHPATCGISRECKRLSDRALLLQLRRAMDVNAQMWVNIDPKADRAKTRQVDDVEAAITAYPGCTTWTCSPSCATHHGSPDTHRMSMATVSCHSHQRQKRDPRRINPPSRRTIDESQGEISISA